MYELTAPPQMSSPYTPAGGSNMSTAPSLGTPIPGTTGGLPSQQGLSVAHNPMAKQLQSMGRGEDSVLVHMTPNEVNSLQGLAMASGGSLTINPHTGLPEAGWLGKLLPTILGGLLAATGVGAPLAAGIVGLGQTAITGDLKKGLMAGLGAFGGASMVGGLGLGGKLAGGNAFGILDKSPGIFGANMGAGAAATVPGAVTAPAATTAPAVPAAATPPPMVGESFVPGATPAAAAPAAAPPPLLGPTPGGTTMVGAAPAPAAAAAPSAAATAPVASAKTGFFSEFGKASRGGLKPGSMASKAAPMLAGMGVVNTISDVTTPEYDFDPDDDKDKWKYRGPYAPIARRVSYPTGLDMDDSSEYNYFTPSNPMPGFISSEDLTPEERAAYGMAKGGEAKTTPKPAGFDDLVKYFQSSSPGAVTASMYPVRPPKNDTTPTTAPNRPSSNEQLYTFGNNDKPKPFINPYTGTGYINPFTGRGYTGSKGSQGGKARGGEVNMDDGSFVVDARTVSELGNGSSNAGMELLSRMGGRPVRGSGDGVSDSVPARIGGKQEARVARDEVVFPAAAVRRIGGGSAKRGTQKLYALMEKAHKARKKAGRGTDTKLRKGLA